MYLLLEFHFWNTSIVSKSRIGRFLSVTNLWNVSLNLWTFFSCLLTCLNVVLLHLILTIVYLCITFVEHYIIVQRTVHYRSLNTSYKDFHFHHIHVISSNQIYSCFRQQCNSSNHDHHPQQVFILKTEIQFSCSSHRY